MIGDVKAKEAALGKILDGGDKDREREREGEKERERKRGRDVNNYSGCGEAASSVAPEHCHDSKVSAAFLWTRVSVSFLSVSYHLHI